MGGIGGGGLWSGLSAGINRECWCTGQMCECGGCEAAAFLEFKRVRRRCLRFCDNVACWGAFYFRIKTGVSWRFRWTADMVACGAASHLRLKPRLKYHYANILVAVACGAASHLR